MDRKVLGRRVRMLRIQKGWKQEDLARESGVTANTLRGLERATQETRQEKIEAVALALGTTLTLLSQADEPITESNPQLRNLTEEDLRIAQAFHHSQTPIRVHIQRVLSGGIDPANLNLLDRLERLSEEARHAVEGILGITEPRPEPAMPTKRKTTTKETGR